VETALAEETADVLRRATEDEDAFQREEIGGYTLFIPRTGSLRTPVRWVDSVLLLDP